mmetsp:Transcript_32732/g.38500  ORF Transcript_32732/g.38500 Transcript_32732/m.38500 type:complete len:100 (+) Transcript_32732:510-809(+)
MALLLGVFAGGEIFKVLLSWKQFIATTAPTAHTFIVNRELNLHNAVCERIDISDFSVDAFLRQVEMHLSLTEAFFSIVGWVRNTRYWGFPHADDKLCLF